MSAADAATFSTRRDDQSGFHRAGKIHRAPDVGQPFPPQTVFRAGKSAAQALPLAFISDHDRLFDCCRRRVDHQK